MGRRVSLLGATARNEGKMEQIAIRILGKFVLVVLGGFGAWLATNAGLMHETFCSGTGYEYEEISE